jgi:hypothetical protein
VKVRDAIIEAMGNVIAPEDATSISPSLPVAYLDVISETRRKYGNETDLRLTLGERTIEKLTELWGDVYEAISTSYTVSDGTALVLIVWEIQDYLLMLDGSWGRRATLKVQFWEE